MLKKCEGKKIIKTNNHQNINFERKVFNANEYLNHHAPLFVPINIQQISCKTEVNVNLLSNKQP